MKKTALLLIVISFALIACNSDKNKQKNSDHLINATLWIQNSAEYTACCHQAYNHARLALDNNLKDTSSTLPHAIVFDLDETCIDNSYFQANLIKEAELYSSNLWEEWSDMESATAVPGAIDFINYAIDKGVEILYVSNRMESELKSTIINLAKLGFPDVPAENYLLKTTESSKIARRAKLAEKYNMILFIGDNLDDFDGIFEVRTENQGRNIVSENKDSFGTKYIILPNPMYGNWEKALIKDDNKSNHENLLKNLIYYSDL